MTTNPGRVPLLAIHVAFDEAGGGLVALAGELDRTSTATLRSRLRCLAVRAGSPVVVDMSGLSFVDLGGYRALAEFGAACRAGGRTVVWKSPGMAMRRLLEILGPLPGTVQDDAGGTVGEPRRCNGHAHPDVAVGRPG